MTSPISSPFPSAAPGSALPGGGDTAIQILSADARITDTPKPIKLTGTILDAARDGTVTIRTDMGNVTAKMQPARGVPVPGTNVEIDIPAPPAGGSASANASMRTAAPQPGNAPQPQPQTPDPAANVPLNPNRETIQAGNNLRDAARARDVALQTQIDLPQLRPGDAVTLKQISVTEAIRMLTAITRSGTMPFTQTALPDDPAMMWTMMFSSPGAVMAKITDTPSGFMQRFLSFLQPQAAVLQGAPENTLQGALFKFGAPSQTATAQQSTPGMQNLPRLGLTAFTMTTPISSQLFTSGAGLFAPGTPLTAATPIQNGIITGITQGVTFLSPAPTTQGQITYPSFTNAVPIVPSMATSLTQTLMVAGMTANGDMLASTIPSALDGNVHFYLAARGGPMPPPGTFITIQPAQIGTPLTVTPAIASPLAPADMMVDTILAYLNTAADAGMRAPVPAAHTPSTLGTAAMLFLAAQMTGSADEWMGSRAIDMLRRAGKSPIGARMNDMMSSLRDASAQGSSGDWKAFLFPMQFQNEIHPISLYIKSGGRDENDARGENGSKRFVLDVHFDRMGAVQLDLLYRPGQLDTVLRTELPLSSAMRAFLEKKYAGAMGNTGHAGALYFQDGANAWFKVDTQAEQVTILT